MMASLKVAASKTWSVVSRVRDCFGPSSVPFGELTVVVASAADIFETDADRGGDGRVDLNADGGLLLAVEIDHADPGDPRNLRRQEVFDIFVDLRNREVG